MRTAQKIRQNVGYLNVNSDKFNRSEITATDDGFIAFAKRVVDLVERAQSRDLCLAGSVFKLVQCDQEKSDSVYLRLSCPHSGQFQDKDPQKSLTVTQASEGEPWVCNVPGFSEFFMYGNTAAKAVEGALAAAQDMTEHTSNKEAN